MAWHSGLRFTFEGIEGVAFDVVRFELIEAISQPFRLELQLSSSDPNIELDALLDRACVFAIERDGKSVRTVHGVISAFEQTASGFRRTRYKAIVEPPLARLGLWQESRIHQQVAIPQILRERFKERSIDAAVKLTRTHEVREFCVQFNESDLHFASRIAVLMRYYDSYTMTESKGHELHLWVDGIYVLLRATSYEGIEGIDNPEPPEKVEDRLRTLAKSVAKVRNPESTRSGFILGPVVMDDGHTHEAATLSFYDQKRPDLTLELYYSAITPDDKERLFERVENNSALFGMSAAAMDKVMGAETLRKGKRPFAGMDGDEWLWVERGGDPRKLRFRAETYRSDPGFMRPSLSATLTLGGHFRERGEGERRSADGPDDFIGEWTLPFGEKSVSERGEYPSRDYDASLTDYEAMALWDAILDSIRPRAGAVAPPRPPRQPPLPVESQAQVQANQRAMDHFIATEVWLEPRES